MKYFASPGWVVAGCALVLLSSSAYMASAAWNRSGEPDAMLTLTERELPVPWGRQGDQTSLDLPLLLGVNPPGVVARAARWRQQTPPVVNEEWIGPETLRALGFRIDHDPTDPEAAEYYQRQIARRAWVVLEYEGEAWNRFLSRREEQVRRIQLQVDAGAAEPAALRDAEALLALDREMRSRLFPVDAGRDAKELRGRYPDRRRFAIVQASIWPRVVRQEDGAVTLTASVQLAVSRVHVPLPLRRRLDPFLPDESIQEVVDREQRAAADGWPEPVPARYEVTVAVGRRLEPWLVSAAPEPDTGT